MRRLFVLLCLALVACGEGNGPAAPEPARDGTAALDLGHTPKKDRVVLGLHESSAVFGTDIAIRFAAVLEDSRCPIDVLCPWEGNCRIAIDVSRPAERPVLLEVNTAVEPRVVEAHGLLIRIVSVTPAPVSTREILEEEYVVTLDVSWY